MTHETTKTERFKENLSSFFKNNWGTLLIVILLLGYAAYQRIPVYLEDQKFLDRPAPDFELPLAEGGSLRLSSLRGKLVLINFWATWCAPCRIEIPLLKEMYGDLSARHGDSFEMLAVASEDPRIVRQFLRENPVNYPVLLDSRGEVARLYSVAVYPSFVFIDEKGVITELDHGMNLFLRWKVRWKVTGSPF